MNKETEKLGLSPSRAAVSEAVSSPGILKRIKNVFTRYCQQLRTKNRRGHVIRFDGCYFNLNISSLGVLAKVAFSSSLGKFIAAAILTCL